MDKRMKVVYDSPDATGIARGHLAFCSNDGHSELRGIGWRNETIEPRGVVQIIHGMTEYVPRYDHVARKLASAGYVVVAFDQVGHGASVSSPEEWGVFDQEQGANILVEDQQDIRRIVSANYPDTPYFMLGHSMGSFVLRCLMGRYGRGLAGVIVSGTAWQNSSTLAGGRLLCSVIASRHGWDYRSPLVDKMGVGSYNKKFESPQGTSVDWLSRDRHVCETYLSSPKCTFVFSLSGYKTIFNLLGECCSKASITSIPKQLPILVLSGDNDPVGDFGRSPRKFVRHLEKSGCTDVTLELRLGDRHETLNELDKLQVEQLIVNWLERVCNV